MEFLGEKASYVLMSSCISLETVALSGLSRKLDLFPVKKLPVMAGTVLYFSSNLNVTTELPKRGHLSDSLQRPYQ